MSLVGYAHLHQSLGLFNTFDPSHLIQETARSRVRIGTELLETLTSAKDDQNLHHLVTAALVSLCDGLGMMGQVQRRLNAQAEQQARSHRCCCVLQNYQHPFLNPLYLSTQPRTTHPQICFKT